MSGAEKRAFSLLYAPAAASKKKPIYLRLFQALSGRSNDLPEFTNEVSSQVYTIGKKRLFNNIMKSLRIFHQETSIEIIIQNHLSEIEILYHHSLPEQSLYVLNKAYHLAASYEQFGLLLHVLEWEGKLNIIMINPPRSIEAIAEEGQEVLQKLTQIMQLEKIYNIAGNMKKEHGYVNGEMQRELEKRTIKAPGMITYEQCNSQKAKFYFNLIHSLYHWMTFDPKNAYAYSRRLIPSTPSNILPHDYIDGVLHHASTSLCIGYFTATQKALALTDDYVKRYKLNLATAFEVKLIYYKLCCNMVICTYLGNLRELKKVIKDAEDKLAGYQDKFTGEMRQVILGNLANAYVASGDMNHADQIMNLLFRKESKAIRKNIYDDLYLFRLFSLLQNRNFALIPSLALSSFRYYKSEQNRQNQFILEQKIAALLMKEIDYENVKAYRRVFMVLEQYITEHLSSLSAINNFQERYTFYLIWMRSLYTKEPFYVQAGKWYKDFKKARSQGREGS